MTKYILKKNWTCFAAALELTLAICFIRQFMRLIVHFRVAITVEVGVKPYNAVNLRKKKECVIVFRLIACVNALTLTPLIIIYINIFNIRGGHRLIFLI